MAFVVFQNKKKKTEQIIKYICVHCMHTYTCFFTIRGTYKIHILMHACVYHYIGFDCLHFASNIDHLICYFWQIYSLR